VVGFATFAKPLAQAQRSSDPLELGLGFGVERVDVRFLGQILAVEIRIAPAQGDDQILDQVCEAGAHVADVVGGHVEVVIARGGRIELAANLFFLALQCAGW